MNILNLVPMPMKKVVGVLMFVPPVVNLPAGGIYKINVVNVSMMSVDKTSNEV